jgi:hypothetical protein
LPPFERTFHRRRHILELGEVPVVDAPSSGELPDSLDRIQLGAGGGEERQLEPRRDLVPPLLVKSGVVVSGIVADDHDTTRASGAVSIELVEELGARDLVEHPLLPSVDQLPIPQSDRSPVADGLVGPGMEEDGIPNFGGNPHSASRAMLLEVDLVHGPEVHQGVLAQRLEFFL